MAFVHEDQGVVAGGQAADLLQGCDVAVHGKGTIRGHQAQTVLLQESMDRGARCEQSSGVGATKWATSSLFSLPRTLGASAQHRMDTWDQNLVPPSLLGSLGHRLSPVAAPDLP